MAALSGLEPIKILLLVQSKPLDQTPPRYDILKINIDSIFYDR